MKTIRTTRVAPYSLLLLLGAAFAVGGCSGDGGSDGAAGSPSAAPDPAPTSETTGGGTQTPPAGGDADSGSPPANDAGDPDAGPSKVPQLVGYAYAGNAGAAQYTPSTYYAFNAADDAIEIKRKGTGSYEVVFSGLTLDGAIAAVTSYGTDPTLCQWIGTAGSTVSVRCLDETGSIADSRFSIAVFDKGTTKGASILGFAHANDMASASYTPQASRSNNAVGGGAITAKRTATGTYAIEFEGLSALDIGNVQVTPYGSGTHCTVASWSGATVNVRCFDSAGALADSQYSVMLAGQKPGGTAKVVGLAHASDKSTASYTPTRVYNATDGAVTATRSAPGTYSIAFDGANLNVGAHVQLGPEGQGRRCNVTAWAGTTVDVKCTDDGADIDNKYAIVVLQ